MDKINEIKKVITEADAVVIGAGAGLSTAAGFVYNGERFEKYFKDFEKQYGFQDMYSGGFYHYQSEEETWAYWSRNIYINRYMKAPIPVYEDLFQVVKDQDYFVLTTNVDHCFQKAGFDKKRLFYTQGDYGLWQCSKPCSPNTYDNEEVVRKMDLAQGFEIAENGDLLLPEGKSLSMVVPSELIPRCPNCGEPMSMNLRADDTFVQDAGWDAAAERYELFERRHQGMKILYLEIGVGFNTPGIIKYNFWHRVYQNPKATYVCLNMEHAEAPSEIKKQSICVAGDSYSQIRELLKR